MVDVDQSLMKTGDILIGRRFAGDSVSMMLLEGGVANHAAMIIEDADNSSIKYVIDCPSSNEQSLIIGHTGVRKTELNEWLGMTLAQDYEMVWLPLNPNLRAYGDLDEDRLRNWFTVMRHSKYSDVSAFFAAIDTPDQSFPPPLNSESFMINLRLYEKAMGRVPDIHGTKLIEQFQEALLFRLKSLMTTQQQQRLDMPTDIESTVLFAHKELNLSLNDLIAIPESDLWHYKSGDGMPIYT